MLRIATLGTSVITQLFIEAASASGEAAVVACCSRDAERASAFAREVGVERGVGGLESVLADREIDAIYVGSPNSAHGAQVRRCLEAGKHVICEKPLTPSAAETESLFALALEHGVVLFEGMRSTYDPGMAAVRELLPTLGAVRLASFRYCQRSARYDQVLAGEQVNIFDPELAGGALLDLGVYCVHALVDLFGAPAHVWPGQVPVASGADGAGVLLAVYPTFVAELTYSKITKSSLPSEIQGELGTMTIDHITGPRHVVVDYLDGRHTDVRPEGAENNLVYEIVRFSQVVGSGEAPVADIDRSVKAARVVDIGRGMPVAAASP